MGTTIMNREDIIRMAREADLIYWFSGGMWWTDEGEPGDELEHFAALVAAAAKAEEREACAKVAENDDHVVDAFYDQPADANATARNIADAIRARGNYGNQTCND